MPTKLNFNINSTVEDNLQKLIDLYNSTPAYEGRTADQIRSQAENEYKSYYDQLRLSARQAQEREDLALAQQAEGLQSAYDKQREASAKAYRQSYSQADRQMLGRGMQRSTYAAQTLANLSQQGDEAQQSIWDQQTAAENNIAAQRQQLAGQLATQLQQYDAGYAADVMKRIQELENQDYERRMQSTEYINTLGAQLYGQMQNYLQANTGSSYGGGGGGYYSSSKKKSSGSSGSSSKQASATPATGSTFDSFLSSINSDYSAIQKATTGNYSPLYGNKSTTSSNPVIAPTVKKIYGPVNQAVLEAANNSDYAKNNMVKFVAPIMQKTSTKKTTTKTSTSKIGGGSGSAARMMER